MFTLVKQRMAPPGDEIAKTVSDAVVALLQTCIGAATTIIKILSTLHEQDLIGTCFKKRSFFLPTNTS
jgi:hypothetical protein